MQYGPRRCYCPKVGQQRLVAEAIVWASSYAYASRPLLTGLALESVLVVSKELAPQLAGMLTLYFFVYLLNLRSRWLGNTAARQVCTGCQHISTHAAVVRISLLHTYYRSARQSCRAGAAPE